MAISRKRLILYASGLVAGFTISPYTFKEFPAFWIRYGITGFALWLVFSVMLLGLAVIYTGIGQKRGQRHGTFVDIYLRKIKGVGFLAFVVIVLLLQAGFLAGETGRILAMAFEIPMASSELIKLLILIGFLYALVRGREKNFYIIMISAFISLFMAMTLTTYGQNLNGQYSSDALKILLETKPLTSSMVIEALITSVLTMGMGVFFYYLLGNFVPTSDIKPKTILTLGFVGSLVASVLAGVGYAMTFGASPQAYHLLTAYANGEIPKLVFLKTGFKTLATTGYAGFLFILATAMLFSTATRVLPALEIALIISRRFYKASRPVLARGLLGIAFVITALDYLPTVHNTIYPTVIVLLFFGALFETLGAIVSETGIRKFVATQGAVLFLSLGIYKFIDLYSTNIPALIISLLMLTIALWINVSAIPSGRSLRVRG
ncbi:membrane protein of unknown function (plasmid) [Thermococcus nautili]|uniref:sodium-dependent transporter n=1 Tax=Thermococcus nautili TaxID=195522 RepID=UPI0025541230|nr:sodium-dependent transporter [Thermococcus nautili]CAI1494234.1 membrane protein of unknown function [Thermococcus nautili]